MRAQVHRVARAAVRVDGVLVGEIGNGVLVYAAAHASDGADDLRYIADKVVNLRVFTDQNGKMNLSLLDVGGAVLLVSAFSLYADARRGRRPSFAAAAPPEIAEALFVRLADAVREYGIRVETGRFREHMEVESVNDGPICVSLDSARLF